MISTMRTGWLPHLTYHMVVKLEVIRADDSGLVNSFGDVGVSM